MCEFEYTEEIRIRRTVRVRKRIVGEPMEICLCSRCASQFYNSPKHLIKRVDPFQTVKEPCTYCNYIMVPAIQTTSSKTIVNMV